MLLGCNTSKTTTFESLQDRIDTMKQVGCTAAELSLNDPTRLDFFESLPDDYLSGFEHRSIHAPALELMYRDDKHTHALLTRLSKLSKRLGCATVVLHPDRVADWEVIAGYNIPWAIENMDHRKQSYQDVSSMAALFAKYDFNMVLDINHCYAVKRSLEFVPAFYENFRERIVEIHLSGFQELHDPLYLTRQAEFIDAIPDATLPIILEGVPNLADLEPEYNYVSNLLTTDY